MDDNPFASPSDEPERDPRTGLPVDTMLNLVALLMLAPALLSGAFTALTAAMTVLALVVDIPTAPGDPPLYVIAPIESCMCMVPTMLYGAAGVGVVRRKVWGWYLALLGLLFWMGGCLAPVALFGFYALLNEGGRRAFGMK
jgi:hypothetical protein